MFFIGHVVKRFELQDTSSILTIWITAEVMALSVEPFYFNIFVPWLNKASDDDVKKIYKDYKKEGKSKKKDLQLALIPSINAD